MKKLMDTIKTRKNLLRSDAFRRWCNSDYLESNELQKFQTTTFICDQCNQIYKFASVDPSKWWIDVLEEFDIREAHNRRVFDLCSKCIEKNRTEANPCTETGKSDINCSRCGLVGVYGEGKWCLNGNMRINWLLGGQTFCNDCHAKLYYNK